ncbi:MAG: flagellar biosynthesis protein FlhB [Deltaproteobacteria bacterium]|nr:flagellar biosynthesis protein FlhB [Deltaproteobacteria bacterium]
MASPFDEDQDRTEAATVFRREEFRRQGTVALSRELVGVILICGVVVFLQFLAPTYLLRFNTLAQSFFKIPMVWDLDKTKALELGGEALKGLMWMSGPLLLVAMVVGVVVCVVQVGWFVTLEPVSPNWERINPVSGFGRIFSTRGLVEAAKAVVKLVFGGFLLYWFVKGQMDRLPLFYSKAIGESTIITLKNLLTFVLSCLGAFLIPSSLDYLYQRYQLEKQMRMTRREAKDELKLREGDPAMKAKIRRLQRQIASRRMMENVPKADVVVTNPTHLAIALKYDQKTMAAPKVVAKGADLIAQKIREVARSHGIPIVENKPLAQTLYKKIEINRAIPRELYKAVAEVLSYVYRLKGMRSALSAEAGI